MFPATVIMIEGSAGVGKSRLLSHLTALAADLGYVTLRMVGGPVHGLIDASAHPGGLIQPGAAPSSPLDRAAGGTPLHGWLVDQVQRQIAWHAAAGPVLFTLDDLHRVPAPWLAALTTWIQRSPTGRVVWALTRRSGTGGACVERLYRLNNLFLERLDLRPLPSATVADLVAELIGERPAPDLLDIAAAADGNPFFLIELVEGLREEGRLTFGRPDGQVVPGGLPHRVRAGIQQQTSALSPGCQHLLQVASVLGLTFQLDSVVRLMGTSMAKLLSAVDEALGAGLLVCVDERMGFSHDLVRRVVLGSIPRSLLGTLRREAELVLLAEEAAPPGEPALSGTISAPPTRPDAPGTGPGVGAEPAPGTEPGSAGDHPLAAEHLDSAVRLLIERLAAPLPPGVGAQRQSQLAHLLVMRGDIRQAVAAADRALADPDAPDEVRDDANAARLLGLSMCDPVRTARAAEAVLAEHERAGQDRPPGPAVAVARTVLSNLLWESGRLAEGLRQGRQAVRAIHGAFPAPWRAHVRLSLARKLANLRHIDDAGAIIQEAQSEVERFGLTLQAAAPAVSRARLLVQAGRLAEARAAARAAVISAHDSGVELLIPLAYSVLATVALRAGDLLTAADYVRRYRIEIVPGTLPLWSVQYDWVELLLVAGQDGPRGAVDLIARHCPRLPGNHSLYVEEPGAAPWLVRLAAATGDKDLGLVAVATAERLALDNPTVSAVQAGALHARGLLDENPALLARAAAEHAEPWARGWACEDLGSHRLRNRDTRGAVRHFEAAVSQFEKAGAARDVTRVRARLRACGVHRRGPEPARQASSGWPSLSEIERTIAHLVNQGLTNRQIAQRVFLSPHTVNYHLRQIFRKLDIGSRVELARLTQQHHLADREMLAGSDTDEADG
jgi:DNA-binding CsgD family transcriptional regulator/tetratricopeptide (TPR) repeat protein